MNKSTKDRRKKQDKIKRSFIVIPDGATSFPGKDNYEYCLSEEAAKIAVKNYLDDGWSVEEIIVYEIKKSFRVHYSKISFEEIK